jgi:hypothetical protein
MKQDERGTIAISLVAYSVALAARRGVAAEPLLAQAGIAPALLAQPRARVSAQQYGALWNAIARALDDEFFGQDRHPMRSGSFIAMSQAALSAQDGLRAMARAVNFMHCVLDDLHAELDANPQRVRLRFVHRNNGAAPAMFTYATYFIIVYGLTCWLIGRRIPVLHASFRCDTPPADHEYPSMLCDDMRFNQPDSYVDFDPEFATLPVVQNAKTLKTFLRTAPASFIVKYRNPNALAQRVRAVLRGCRPRRGRARTGWPRGCTWPRRRSGASCTRKARPTSRSRTRCDAISRSRRWPIRRARSPTSRRPPGSRNRARSTARFANGAGAARPSTAKSACARGRRALNAAAFALSAESA